VIRHQPFGSGHAYLLSDEQRVPPRPEAGERIELRVTTAGSDAAPICEWESGGVVRQLPMLPVVDASPSGVTASEPLTHLAAAAAGLSGRTRRKWFVQVGSLGASAVARYRFTTRADDNERSTRWFEVGSAQWVADRGSLESSGHDRVVSGSTQWFADADGVYRVKFALSLQLGEHVLGFGERFDRLDQRGHRIDAAVFEQYKGQAAAGRTYLPMPFAHVLGGDGWGFHVRTSRRVWFDVGASDDNTLWVEAELGGRNHEELQVAFYEGSPVEVLNAFLTETGKPTALPSWVHRLWASGNEWNTQNRVTAEIDRHFVEDIPVGVVVVEAWSDESTFAAFRDATYEVNPDGAPHRLADFTFPAEGAWPAPTVMVEDLHARDVKILLWQIPLQKMRPHPTGQAHADAVTMTKRGYVVKEADGRAYRNRGWWFPLALLPDFTNPDAREWWLAKRRYLIDEIGIDGFKTDGGEHAWGHDLRYANGERGDEGNNLYPVRYAAAYGDLLRDAGRAPVTFSRAGFTGSAAHGCFWAGDEDSTWEAYRGSLTAGLNAAASGIVYWGWDIGGFSGPLPSAELYLRSTATACFAPIMQYHSEFNHHREPSRDRTPWNVAEQSDDPAVLDVFRRFAHLRDRLVPYLVAQAAETIATGRPLMQALPLAYPHDDQSWTYEMQYLLGADLLVCPVTEEGATSRRCYLPAGDWVDVWNGATTAGPAFVDRDVPLDVIPVWCRKEAWLAIRSAFQNS
jgi:1,3-alpha-isomaltosidase